jgi:hypothetical protein
MTAHTVYTFRFFLYSLYAPAFDASKLNSICTVLVTLTICECCSSFLNISGLEYTKSVISLNLKLSKQLLTLKKYPADSSNSGAL